MCCSKFQSKIIESVFRFQENGREMELELREELDLVQAKVRETERARNTAYEIIADHEATIQKFRGLVNQVKCLLKSLIFKTNTTSNDSHCK